MGYAFISQHILYIGFIALECVIEYCNKVHPPICLTDACKIIFFQGKTHNNGNAALLKRIQLRRMEEEAGRS